MKKKILEWLEKTGFPLELYGEKILNELQFKIINSYIYVDFEKQISRELDLFATYYVKKNNIGLNLDLLVECKKSDKAIILLRNQNVENIDISLGQYCTIDNPNSRAIMGTYPKISLPGQSSFGFKIIQGFTDGDEFINKAANTLIKSLYGYNSESLELIENAIENNEHSLALPVLLLDAPLFELFVNENQEMELNEIDSCVLEYRNLTSSFDKEFLIPVIQKRHFKEFIENYKKTSEQILEFLISNPSFQIKKYHTTKIVFKDM